ncbi:MAG: EF-P lysine aminoacylase GenX [Polyangiaceae bacterium]|nr:EF-P lysine aminoacylase GenX [Polyangiaceae bacterium]
MAAGAGREWVLADALATCRVRFERATPLAAGELVVVSGRLTGGSVVERARLVARYPYPAPRGDGEHARLSWAGVGPRLVARAQALAAIRGWFAPRGFVEVETPLRVRTPGVDAHVDALRAEGGYLITSPELSLKRLLVGGMPRVFQLARVTRLDEAGPLHLPEFTLLEWYRAFSGMSAVIDDTEALVRHVVSTVAGRSSVERAGRRVHLRAPFERVTVREAFRRFAGVADAVTLAETNEDEFFARWVAEVEPALARLERPVFVVEYPATQAALARRSPADGRVAERFELYLAGVELCNGYGELTDAVEQRARFVAERAARRRTGRRVYPLDDAFLRALGEGMPPSGGNALGVDRLVLLTAGAERVEAVAAVPGPPAVSTRRPAPPRPPARGSRASPGARRGTGR